MNFSYQLKCGETSGKSVIRRHPLRMLDDPEIHGRLHQHLNRWQAAAKNQLAEGLRAMLLKQTANQGVHKRTVGATDSGEIQHHLVTDRSIRINLRHVETIRLRPVAQAWAEFVAQMDLVRHG
jgi:hypothetical protein